MDFELVPSSPEALNSKQLETRSRIDYPFDKMQVGQSFAVAFGVVTEQALRTAVSRRNKYTDGWKFRVLKHNEHSTYEVARIS